MADERATFSLRNRATNYFIATRPWSFTASATSVLLGTVLAYKMDHSFDLRLYLLTLISVMSAHAAGNLVNNLYHFMNLIDTELSSDKTLVDGIHSQHEIHFLISFCYQLAVCSFVIICNYFPHVALAKSLPLFLIYIVSSFVFTGGVGLKSMIMLRDIVISIVFGPLVTLLTYCIQTGQLWINSIAYAIPLALLSEAILHGNNICDIKTDQNSGIVTLAILFGQSKASIFYTFLLFLPYVIIIYMAWSQSIWLLLPTLSLPLAIHLNLEYWHSNKKCNYDNREHNHSNDHCHGNLAELNEKNTMLNLVFSVLYIVGLFIWTRD